MVAQVMIVAAVAFPVGGSFRGYGGSNLRIGVAAPVDVQWRLRVEETASVLAFSGGSYG